jgi:hypothetical protein|tara:strand:- start:2113 stop:4560 length:2448 start_codon:yes stop_codon:yes gene_type:complete
MNEYNNSKKGSFPDPLAETEVKESKAYGLKYAKAIETQWGKMGESNSLYGKRNTVFERSRDYANGTQDTNIYKKLLNSLDPNSGDGSLLNMDYTPVPILPKFVRVVVNKILSRNPYPNLEAIDPLSSSEKNDKKRKLEIQVEAKKQLQALKQQTGMVIGQDPDTLPDTLEEAEILIGANVKTDAEIAAQIGTNMTLSWNNFNDGVFRRNVNDLVALGLAVVKRSNDPNEGIKTEYVDPCAFIHSYTEDPSFEDLIYAGHVKRMSIADLKRLAGHELEEEDFKKIAASVKNKTGNDSSAFNKTSYNNSLQRSENGYDQYMVEVLDFEFISVDCIYFEEKENKFGNVNFFMKGFDYEEKQGSVFQRTPSKMEVKVVYSGSYIMGGCEILFNYGKAKNIPKNIHDISKVSLSYSAIATNIRNMMPKSMVDSCTGFADMLQLTHLKIQQAIAKAKPDGLIIDIEGLENVQLGKGGDLQPLELHDIYEQTGVFYYRSKNPEGGFQNPPVREIGNSIRNVNELIGLYNHYLKMIRDATGVNEMMDASTPKGDTLVGVQQNAIAAGNNAIYDITNASMILFKKVCEDVVKCLQILPSESVIYQVYENAVGKENMSVLSSFNDLPMYNFGVQVVKEMEDQDRAYLEQNIQISLQQKELDIEDAIAIRSMKDVNQAERLLVIRRKKRMAAQQQMAQQNSQQQAQIQQASAQATSQAKMQELQMEAQLESQKLQLQAQLEAQLEEVKHQFRKEIEIIKAQATLGFKEDDKNFKEKLDVLKEDRKDDRVKKQAVEQSKLMSQRNGQRGELPESADSVDDIVNSLLG